MFNNNNNNNNKIMMFQINKILDIHPSVDLGKFCNRNAIDKFQITSKLYH